MRLILVFVFTLSLLFAKVDYSQMSNEELIALIGYVSLENKQAFTKELQKRLPTFTKKEKQMYEKATSEE